MSIGQQSKNIKVKSGAESNAYYVGEFNIAEPGYIRVNIEPVSTTAKSYPSISEFLLGGEAVANATAKIKDEVVFEVNDLQESGGWVVSTASYKEFAVDMDKHILKFGCGYEGKEYYILYNGTCGGIRNYMIRLFGVEKNNGYDVKRMILSAEEDTYYEFKPVK